MNQKPSGVESDSITQTEIELTTGEQAVESFTLTEQHLKLTAVEFKDVTDRNNELAQATQWLLHTSCRKLELRGNLFIIHNMEAGTGIILIKQYPLPDFRPQELSADLVVIPEKAGFSFYLIQPIPIEKSLWTTLEYSGGILERTKALHEWQQAQRPDTPAHREVRFLSNTWGDRNRDSRINEDFIKAEIDAAAALGADVVQIDDGWQQGTTANSAQAAEKGGLWEGFWNGDPDFWKVHSKRLPNGLEPILAHAEAAGVRIGLWYAPDSWNECANWEKDADCILNIYKTYGIEHIKIDSVVTETDQTLSHLDKFFSTVLEKSGGNVVFDFDITAGVRPGYFGQVKVGPLFIENRYTDWHNYWPHQTLRNLWSLAQWIDPRRLRMEFLNNSRNTEKYPDDPLAPAVYPADTLFATVMFSNPLGWFEASNLPQEYIEQAAPLISTWQAHKADLFSRTILPIGSKPDGFAYTGFLAVADDGQSGYALIFREHSEESSSTLNLPGLDLNDCRWEMLNSSGVIGSAGEHISVSIPEQLGFVFAKFEK